MRSFLCAAGPLALLGFGVLASAVHCRGDRRGVEEPDPVAVQAQRRELDRQLEAVRVRSEASRRLIDELIEGRLSLAQAVEQFMMLNRGYPEVVTSMRYAHPDADERESATRQVLIRTRDEIERRQDLTPEARRRVLERLETARREMSE